MSTKSNAQRFEDEAKQAVGRALLYRASPRGGSYGHGLDECRAEKVTQSHLTGPELYDLLLDVAKRAVEGARQEAEHQRWTIVDEVRRLAEVTDSLSLYKFIESEDAYATERAQRADEVTDED